MAVKQECDFKTQLFLATAYFDQVVDKVLPILLTAIGDMSDVVLLVATPID